MSGTSSPGPAPDALELAALLCSRVCHDLISPVGAIVNGLEVLDDDPKPDDREFALDLIRKSAKTASARLQFCRLAFGAAGSAGAQIDLGDAADVARSLVEDGRVKLDWQLPRLLLPKDRVKLLLNLVLVAVATIPRGGTVRIEAIGAGERMGFRLEAQGQNARIQPAVPGLLAGTPEEGVDSHGIQPFYAGLLARASHMQVLLASEGDKVVLTAAEA
jgi:histidine phosphotransferase ChpT